MLKIYPSVFRLKYLITGTGRCGTTFMARLLTSLGEMCGHEAVFNTDGEEKALKILKSKSFRTSECSSRTEQEWFIPGLMTSESSYMAAPFLHRPLLDNTKIIHIVRHPLKVISSHIKDVHFFDYPFYVQAKYQKFVLQHMPELNKIKNITERACYYYVHWNEMIENNAANRPYLFQQVESKLTPELLQFMSIAMPSSKSFHDDEKTNSWNKRDRDITLNDIPEGTIKNEFINLMGKYGYQP